MGGGEIAIGRMARLSNCKFYLLGQNCKIIIGTGTTIISNTTFYCEDDNSSIIIGDDFTMTGGNIAATEGRTIRIGDDCMFSNDIEIRNGDSHSIFQNEKRINDAADVVICNHVWLTAHCRIMKGSYIASNSVVGNSSVVSSKLDSPNSLYVGIPAKRIKDNIVWTRNR